MTRLDAAERAVVEAAMRGAAISLALSPKWLAEFNEARERLSDLRASLGVGQDPCGIVDSPVMVVKASGNPDSVHDPRCYLHIGHDGQHEAALGVWRWEA